MQGINAEVRNSVFFITYFLTPAVALIVALVLRRSGLPRPSNLLVLASVIYTAGILLPTGMVNVPMNEALARVVVPADGGQASDVWTSYSPTWTTWNAVRTGFSVLSLLATCLCLARLGKPVSSESNRGQSHRWVISHFSCRVKWFEPNRRRLMLGGDFSSQRNDQQARRAR